MTFYFLKVDGSVDMKEREDGHDNVTSRETGCGQAYTARVPRIDGMTCFQEETIFQTGLPTR